MIKSRIMTRYAVAPPAPVMKDMAMSPAEVKQDMPESISSSNGPRYPYGLCLSLGQDELQKLGMCDDSGAICLPQVGATIHIVAMSKVTSVSQNESEGGNSNCRVELQITQMAAENEDTEMADDESME